MCDPATIGLTITAVSATSAVMGFMGQNQAAHANEQAAQFGYSQTQNQLGEREAQIDQQQAENTVQAEIARRSAEGRISASAAAGGLDAATTGREANAADFAAGRGLSILDINSENQRLGVANDQTASFYRRQSQINQVLPQSPLTLALNLAKAGVQGYGAYMGAGGQMGGTHGDGTVSTGRPGAGDVSTDQGDPGGFVGG